MHLQHARLIVYLAAQPADVRSVTLTFAEAAALLAGPLPLAARRPTWWVVRPEGARRPGWVRGHPHITPGGWAVTFRQVPPDMIEEPTALGRP